MNIPEDFKTRLKIAKSKIKRPPINEEGKEGHLWVMHLS